MGRTGAHGVGRTVRTIVVAVAVIAIGQLRALAPGVSPGFLALHRRSARRAAPATV